MKFLLDVYGHVRQLLLIAMLLTATYWWVHLVVFPAREAFGELVGLLLFPTIVVPLLAVVTVGVWFDKMMNQLNKKRES